MSTEAEAHEFAGWISELRTEIERLTAALEPFKSGEWGSILAWIVEGAPNKAEGIAAARLLRQRIYAVDHVLHESARDQQLTRPVGTPCRNTPCKYPSCDCAR